MALSVFFYVLTIVGTVAFAISGIMSAIKNHMDLSGAIFLAFITANGGGTIRDLLLRVPVFWLHQESYFWITAGCVAIVYISQRSFSTRMASILLIVTDAIGLAIFTLIGLNKGLIVGQSHTIACIMGILTAVGGGLLRDTLCNEVPLVFRKELYITVALAGSLIYFILLDCHVDLPLASSMSIIFMIAMRLASVYFNWNLPSAARGK